MSYRQKELWELAAFLPVVIMEGSLEEAFQPIYGWGLALEPRALQNGGNDCESLRVKACAAVDSGPPI